MNAPAVVRAISEAGGPNVDLVRSLTGGAVGAWVVRWPDGHDGVLTLLPEPTHGQQSDTLGQAVALMDLAAQAGLPIPRYEQVVPLPDGSFAVLQQLAYGSPPDDVTMVLVEQLLEFCEVRRNLLTGTVFSRRPLGLHLHDDGPEVCDHSLLRQHSSSTRKLVEWIEATINSPGDDVLLGDDIVHFDYHVGNILVDPTQPDQITAIVDWGGTRPGQIELDMAMLAFDLTWRAPGAVQQHVERRLIETADSEVVVKVWAHASLRLLDFAIRHHPRDVDHWLTVATRHINS